MQTALNMRECNQPTITDAAFANLRGIHILDMRSCNQSTITDAAFANLCGIHMLDMYGCDKSLVVAALALGLPVPTVGWF
jgi:hypothetical protein